MKKQELGTVISNIQTAKNLHFIKIEVPEIAPMLRPGNFISILPPVQSGTFIRRPFSVADVSGSIIMLVIKNIGKATAAITRLAAGDTAEIMGPLGHGYPEFGTDKKIWLIGGGTGIASLLFLRSRRPGCQDRLLWGGRTKDEIPAVSNIPCECFISTDDGTAGEKGTSIDVAKKWLETGKPDIIVSCGPKGLLKAVKQLSAETGIPAWISTEEFMACGMGACAGCAVPLEKGGYAKACADGPVFRAEEVIL